MVIALMSMNVVYQTLRARLTLIVLTAKDHTLANVIRLVLKMN